MENAGTMLENGLILKGKGIGTRATRAAVMQKLFDVGYMVIKTAKKVSYIEPTKLGINYIKVLPTELYSPKVTADWEARIAAIADGYNTTEQFMSDFQGFVDRMLKEAENTAVENVDFNAKESVAVCPFCKQGNVYVGKRQSEKTGKEIDVYYCSLKCGFILYQDNGGFYNNTERLLKQSQVIQLIENGSVTAKTKYKNDAGKEKNGKFELLKSDKGKAYIRLADK
jgi:DNA topoisomerase-3